MIFELDGVMQSEKTPSTMTCNEFTIPYRYYIAPARAKVMKKLPAITDLTATEKASSSASIASMSTKAGVYRVGTVTFRYGLSICTNLPSTL